MKFWEYEDDGTASIFFGNWWKEVVQEVDQSTILERLNRCTRNDICMKCKGETVVVRRNRKTGEPFFGCSQYPQCTWTRSARDSVIQIVVSELGV